MGCGAGSFLINSNSCSLVRAEGRISPVRKLCSKVSRLIAPDCQASTKACISATLMSDASKSVFNSYWMCSGFTSSGVASVDCHQYTQRNKLLSEAVTEAEMLAIMLLSPTCRMANASALSENRF